jgi:hypothetical protein
MAVEETLLQRGMNILFLVGIAMVMSMVGGPPEGTSLSRSVTEDREKKLPETINPKGLVGKIAMIEARNGKHAHKIEKQSHKDRHRTPTHPNQAKAPQM